MAYPSAVVVIAAVLASKEKKEQLWQEVARNLSSHISDNQNKFMHILELSYEHLPNHLKPCFLYFGAFEEDMEIPAQKLISLWVAEGFINKEEQKCLEDVAQEYLMQLIDRSLVLVSRRRFDGEVKTCKVHDLLREMCLKIGEEKNFLKVFKFNDYEYPPLFFSQVSMYQQHHCFSICYGEYPIYTLPFGLHVRSLLCDNIQLPTLISSSFKVLRALDFSRSSEYHNVIGIEHLVHLRYLAISCRLPPMESFHKLEFLDVNNFDKVEIPDVLLNMMSLRHMHFRGGAYFSAATKENRSRISNNLRSISVIIISDETDEKVLRRSPNLRRMKCRITSSFDCSFDFFNQLRSLKLQARFSSPRLMNLPLNLKKLKLVHVEMYPQQMQILGGSLNLEVLKLEHVSFDKFEWTASSEFPQLKFLKLNWVQLTKWNASSDNFPSLERLVLRHCNHLKMIPSSFGGITALQKIEVYGCAKSVKESVKQIQEDQLDMGNEELKVIISD